MIKDMRFGALFRELRIKNEETLRQYCLARGFDTGNISKMERGLISPPNTRRQLMKYLKGLKFSELDYEFLVTAAQNHHAAMVLKRFEQD